MCMCVYIHVHAFMYVCLQVIKPERETGERRQIVRKWEIDGEVAERVRGYM